MVRRLFLPLSTLVSLFAPGREADVVPVRPGTAVETDATGEVLVVVRIDEAGSYLVTATPALTPAPPLECSRGDHAFRFATDAARGRVRVESAAAVADRLAEAAERGDEGAVAAADDLAARSESATWDEVRGAVHRAAGRFAAARSDLGSAIAHHGTAAEIGRELRLPSLEAEARRALATLRIQIGDGRGALEEATRYHEVRRDAEDPCATADADVWYAAFLTIVGRDDDAIAPLTAAAEAAEALGDERLRASVAIERGGLHERRGERDRARRSYEEAVRIGLRARDPDPVATASTRIALLDRAEDRLDDAIGRLRDVAADEETPPFQRLDAIGRLARTHYVAGEYAASLVTCEELADRARAEGMPYFAALGAQGAANALLRLGRLAAARDRFREALAAHEEQGNDLRRNETLRALGVLEARLGDEERALDRLEEALRAARDRDDRVEEVLALLVLADLRREGGDPERAAELLAIAARRAAEGTGLSTRVAVARIEHALETGASDDAYAAAEEALAALRSGAAGGGVRAVLPLLARAALATGRIEEAAAAAREALDATAPEDAESRLDPLAVVAAAALDRGDARLAGEALEEAAGHLDRLAGRGDLEIESAVGLRSRYAEFAALRHDLTAIEAAAGDAAAVARGFEAAGAWKGRGLLEGIAEHRRGGRTRAISLLRRKRDELEDRRAAVLERVFERTYRHGQDVSALREHAERLRREIEETAAELLARSPRDAALDRPRGATVDEVRAALGEEDRLIEFAEGRRRLYAFVVDRRSLAFHDLGDAAEVRGRVERFVAGISDPDRLAGAAEVASRGRDLSERLLSTPLGGPPDGRLLIVPSISLSVLPFEALVVAAPDSPTSFEEVSFVDDRCRISYAPSSPVLTLLAATPRRAGAGRVLALADPIYEGEAAESTAEPPPARLQKTRGEALALARLRLADDPAARDALDEAARPRSGSFVDGRVAVHLGADVSRELLLGPLRDVRILHLAAHGVVRRDAPRRSGLLLGRRDGALDLFSTEDALALDLDAELVVLSACSTARGRPRRGEGIESLARAFLHAGARHVVASLWDVSDAAAVRTMRRFYEALLGEDAPPDRALHAARQALRRTAVEDAGGRGVGGVRAAARREAPVGHPFVWAPFVHIGAPGRDG
ncbi:MAG: CHAT domain-containing protein [Planctomycetota bacterium JB042]